MLIFYEKCGMIRGMSMPLKHIRATRKLSVTINKDLYDFLDFLMVEKHMNKSAVVEHMIYSAINIDDEYRRFESEFTLKQYDMFEKKKERRERNKDKTMKINIDSKEPDTSKK